MDPAHQPPGGTDLLDPTPVGWQRRSSVGDGGWLAERQHAESADLPDQHQHGELCHLQQRGGSDEYPELHYCPHHAAAERSSNGHPSDHQCEPVPMDLYSTFRGQPELRQMELHQHGPASRAAFLQQSPGIRHATGWNSRGADHRECGNLCGGVCGHKSVWGLDRKHHHHRVGGTQS